jgi:hypothetical protein
MVSVLSNGQEEKLINFKKKNGCGGLGANE